MQIIERTLTSNEVAEMVGKEHSRLLKDIRIYIGYLAEGKIAPGDFFIESTYLDGNNQSRPNYLLTKQGCEMVSNKLTGAKGVTFTAKYVSRFNEMENHIKEQQLDTSQLSPELQIAQQLLNATSNLERKQYELETRVKNLEESKGSQKIVTLTTKELVEPERLYTSSEIAEQFGYNGPSGVYVFHNKLHELKIIYPKKWGARKINWRLYKQYRKKGYKDLSSLAKAQLWTEKGKCFLEEVIKGEQYENRK